MTQKLQIDQNALMHLFSHLICDENQVFWMIAPDFSEQIYVSNNFEKIWGRACDTLYQDAKTWSNSLLIPDFKSVQKIISTRIVTETSQPGCENQMLFRIKRPNGQMRWIKDFSFNLFDSNGQQIAVAGIGENICKNRWNELFENTGHACNFMTPAPLHDKFQHILQNDFKLTSKSPVKQNVGQECVLIIENKKVKLTPREAECLKELLKGNSTKLIARILKISPRTVEAYLDKLRQKAHCHSRLELISKIKNKHAVENWAFC